MNFSTTLTKLIFVLALLLLGLFFYGWQTQSTKMVVSDKSAQLKGFELKNSLTPSTLTLAHSEGTSNPKQLKITKNLETKNSLPGQRTVRFKSEADYLRFLAELKKRGILTARSIAALKTVRLIGTSDEALEQLLNGFEAEEVGLTYRVNQPENLSELVKNSPTTLLPFDEQWYKSLGLTQIDPHWGKGVQVAILDSGVGVHETLEGLTIQRISLGEDGSAVASNGSKVDGHGTGVASLIAGRRAKVPGLAPESNLLSINVFDQAGNSDSFRVAEAIVMAVDAGNKVINLSLGSAGDSPVLRDAVNYALGKGVALVAATGNESIQAIVYPARYPGVLAVGAADASARPSFFSNYGKELGVLAPGVALPAGWSNNQSIAFSGTSAAAGVVTGAIAAILSQEPRLSPLQAAQLLKFYADDLGAPGQDLLNGFGMANVGRVLERNTRGIVDGAVNNPWVSRTSVQGGPVTLAVSVQNRGTTKLWNTQLQITTGGLQQTFAAPSLEPGQSWAQEITIYPSQLNNGEAIIQSNWQIPFASDRNLYNNVNQSRILIKDGRR